MVGQDSGAIDDAKKAMEPIVGEKNILVTGKPYTVDQKIIYGAATISEYIQKNPDKKEAVEYVLAAAQGPKGVILLAAQKALANTSAGQALAEYQDAAVTKVGTLIADSLDMKVHDLNNADDVWVVGGGKLMATLLIGASMAGAAKAASVARNIGVEVDGAGAIKGKALENLSPVGAGRRGAFNEAKRQSGIPTSQQPSRVLPNTDKRGNLQPGKIYEFDIPAPGGGTKIVMIRDDAGGHYYGPGNPENRGSHFNDEAKKHYGY